MKSPSLKAVTEITCLAPQFLVNDLSAAIGYYRDRLGFEPDFVYESFYASVSRDGFSIHLKCAPKTVADRTHRKQNEHLDAYVEIRGIEALFDELKSKGPISFDHSKRDRGVARTSMLQMSTTLLQ